MNSGQPPGWRLLRRGIRRRMMGWAIYGILAFWQVLFSVPVSGQSLVRVGDTWKYLRGSREPANPPTAWMLPGFDDTAWESGPSGFGPVYPLTATPLYEMPGAYVSVYLRSTFEMARPEDLVWLILRADYGGGFVASINGREVLRRGLPGVPHSWVPHDTLAEPHAYGQAEEFDLSEFIPLLRPGRNLLAIQAHNSSPSSYAFAMVPELTANFTRQPVLQNVSSNQALILWRTLVPSESQVAYGPTPALGFTQSDTRQVREHALTLSGLEPGREYFYQVASRTGDRWARSETHRFRTLTQAGPLKFVVVADTGSGAEPQYLVARVMREVSPELVLHLGDVMYPYFTMGQVETKCFSIYEPQMRHTPFFFVIGNHDRYGMPTEFFDAFYLPTNRVNGTEQFFSFEHGDAFFACLDNDVYARADYSVGSPQYRWLDAELAGTRKPWKFICLHHTVRSSGIHRNDDYDQNGVFDRVQLQESIERLAARHGVQVIFQAHDHLYERFNPVNGVHTLTSGGGGYALYPFGGIWDEATCQFHPVYHCLEVTVDADELAMRALDLYGNEFDRLHLRRSPTPRRVYAAAWHTPQIDPQGLSDGDGNIDGQAFGFVGDPIPAQAGAWANLGRLYVNHDGQNLYLGFESCMIYASQMVGLFVEAPRLLGVSNLETLGNGVPDAAGEGVDGLDFLALDFLDFRPAVACLLGDEYADGQSRGFARTGAALPTGQGVFYLAPGFPDVPGIRLQQFNRSPQYGSAPGEQNADFIQVSIPLSQLGQPQPGERIRVGAVAAFFESPSPAGLFRAILDPGCLGALRTGHSPDALALEGVAVVLAGPSPDPIRVGIDAALSNRVRLSWTAVPGRRYVVEKADHAVGPYAAVADPAFPMMAVDTVCAWEQDLGGAGDVFTARFYRVRLLAAP